MRDTERKQLASMLDKASKLLESGHLEEARELGSVASEAIRISLLVDNACITHKVDRL